MLYDIWHLLSVIDVQHINGTLSKTRRVRNGNMSYRMLHWNSSHEIIVRYWEIGSCLTMSTNAMAHTHKLLLFICTEMVIFGILHSSLLIKYSMGIFRLVVPIRCWIAADCIGSKSHFQRSIPISMAQTKFPNNTHHANAWEWNNWAEYAETIKISGWNTEKFFMLAKILCTHVSFITCLNRVNPLPFG